MVQRFVHKGAWLFLGSLLALIWAIDWPFVAAEGIESTAVASSASRFTKEYVSDVRVKETRRATETRRDNDRSSLVRSDGPTAEWAEAKRAWYRYHRHILPIAVASFFLSFGLWSLLGVENLAVCPQK